MEYLTAYNVAQRLERAVQDAGSQKEFARENGLSQQYVNDVWNGRREPGYKILTALGLRRVIVYAEVAASK